MGLNKQGEWLANPTVCFFLFSLMLLVFRLFLHSPVLELDEAEQMVMAQQFSRGYPAQPPLYTWIQFLIFQGLGYSVFSLALLKYSLLFACLCIFHQIALAQGRSLLSGKSPQAISQFAWIASLAWLFIPPISFDLIKDNTHSVLALLSACMTWYWFQTLDKCKGIGWYLILGLILGIGFLSKFNYLIFLGIFLISFISIPVWRQRLSPGYLILSVVLGLMIASPYICWLIQNHALGLSSIYKLTPDDKTSLTGLIDLCKSISFFTLPPLIIFTLLLRLHWHKKPMDDQSQLLRRYHWISFPILVTVVLAGGLGRFETRWLIPIYFISPLLWLIHLPSDFDKTKVFIKIIIIALLIQASYFIALFCRSHDRHKIRNQYPFNELAHSIQENHQPIDYIVSDSHWILGNLLIRMHSSHPVAWLVHSQQSMKLPKGKLLCLWEQESGLNWLQQRPENSYTIRSLLDQRVLGWWYWT